MQGLWQWQANVFNTVYLFIPCLNFLSPFLSKLIMFLPHQHIFVQPHSSLPSSASSCPCEAPFLNHFLSLSFDSSHSLSPPQAFHFKPPFSNPFPHLPVFFPRQIHLFSLTPALPHEFCSPLPTVPAFKSYTSLSFHLLSVFPISSPSLVVSMQKQLKQKQSNLIPGASDTIALSHFVGWMHVQFDQHRKILNC